MAVAVAPEAAEVGGGLAGFLGAVGAFTLWLLWRFTIGFLILRLADIFAAVSIPTGFFGHIKPFNFAAKDLRAIDRNVNNALWKAMLASEHFGVWLFLEAGHQIAATTGAIWNTTVATGEAFDRLERRYLPYQFRSHVGPVQKQVTAVRDNAKTMDKTLRGTAKTATHADRVAHNTATVALPRVDAGSRTRDKALTKDGTHIKERVSHLEQATKRSVLVALIGATIFNWFRKQGLGWVRCTNVGRIGRAFCRAPEALIGSLLTDALEIAVLTDLCDVVRLAELAAEEFEPAFAKLVALQDNLCLGGGSTRPTAVPSKTEFPASWFPSAVPEQQIPSWAR